MPLLIFGGEFVTQLECVCRRTSARTTYNAASPTATARPPAIHTVHAIVQGQENVTFRAPVHAIVQGQENVTVRAPWSQYEAPVATPPDYERYIDLVPYDTIGEIVGNWFTE